MKRKEWNANGKCALGGVVDTFIKTSAIIALLLEIGQFKWELYIQTYQKDFLFRIFETCLHCSRGLNTHTHTSPPLKIHWLYPNQFEWQSNTNANIQTVSV